ncbi:hypothetical protein [Streptomyces sp. BPTC-684]|uniref:hypothetical protein n=1 Tax=Streptomyces sp. BPTC-684 TaxID=3043734 RepID=UPI0024B1C2F8|nr:hypothetical protein [Streptomyces sp. BPTC-684]WHM38027.1 hypothetical protein QIY60_14635 [Streptomyces sp. BPTC-684]
MPDLGVPMRRPARVVDVEPVRASDRIAVPVQPPGSEMVDVVVGSQHSSGQCPREETSIAQALGELGPPWSEGRRQIAPAVLEPDRVADRTPGIDVRPPLGLAIGETHPGIETVATEPVAMSAVPSRSTGFGQMHPAAQQVFAATHHTNPTSRPIGSATKSAR